MCRMGQDLSWYQYLDKNLKYLQPVLTLCIFALIFYAIIPKKMYFLGIFFCGFDFFFVFTKNACFIYALYSNVTAFLLLSLKKTMQKTLPGFMIVRMENIWLHKSGVNSTFYNVAMKGFHYYCAFLFELLLFVWLWLNYYLQLRYIYLFPPTIWVWYPKSLVSYDKLYLSLKPNWLFAIYLHNLLQEFMHW